VVLDRPEAFVHAMREFLDDLDMRAAAAGAHAPYPRSAP
jgi:hypothetical protein